MQVTKSEENYSFIEDNNQIEFIKQSNYEISKTRKYKNDIGRIENMDYDSGNDLFICQNGKTLKVDGIKFKKSKTEYKIEKQFIYVRIVVIVVIRVNVLKGIILYEKELFQM